MMKSSRRHRDEIRVASGVGDHSVDEAAASRDSWISGTIIVIGQSHFDTAWDISSDVLNGLFSAEGFPRPELGITRSSAQNTRFATCIEVQPLSTST